MLQEEVQELSRLKADIFTANLAVHRLMAAVDDSGQSTAAESAALEAARETVIGLYSLWAEASSALSLRKVAEQQQLRLNTSDRPKRRRKQRTRQKTENEMELETMRVSAGSPDDSGYSEAASNVDPRATRDLTRKEGDQIMSSVEADAAADKSSRCNGGLSMGWLGRVGRAALYSCLLAAALLPLVMYSARPPQCCEFMYPTPHWIHFQYVNGPPPI